MLNYFFFWPLGGVTRNTPFFLFTGISSFPGNTDGLMYRRTFYQNIGDQKLNCSCVTAWLKWQLKKNCNHVLGYLARYFSWDFWETYLTFNKTLCWRYLSFRTGTRWCTTDTRKQTWDYLCLAQKLVDTHQSVPLTIMVHLVTFRHLHGGSCPPFGGGTGKPADGVRPRLVLSSRGVRTAAHVWYALGFPPSGMEDKRTFSC